MATERRTSRGGGNPGGGGAEWLTLGQAATYLGVAQSTVRKWSDGGRLSAFYTPGGHRRFRRADLDAFLAGSSGGTTATAERPLVLIVDDDEQLREFVRVNLEMDGYVVREAGSAEEGLAALDAEPPDLVLLDVMMPVLGGHEACRRLRERSGPSVKIVMLSARGGKPEVEKGLGAGADLYVVKPFSTRELMQKIQGLLG